MTILVADVESDGFLDVMTRLWTVQITDAEDDNVVVYADQPGYPPISEAISRLQAADQYVFHFGLGFDLHAINKIYPGAIVREKMLDTLVMARLAFPEERDHSLKAWGRRMELLKGEYTGDFSKFDEELVTYARQDVVVGRALFQKVKHVMTWGHSCGLEHRVAWAIRQQELNGFTFDVPAAEELAAELREEKARLTDELQAVFPPLERVVAFTPKVNNTKRGYVKGQLFLKKHHEVFNPASRANVAERLQALGWKPQKFGEDGVPAIDEKILGAMKHPLAKVLQRFFRVEKQLGMLADGRSGWLRLVKPSGRIHGRVNPNGTRVGRMSHSGPNLAQADKRDIRMRALFIPKAGWKLVGCDGEGIQLRILAHYLSRYDGGQLAERLVNGDSSKRTDAHSANLKSLVQSKVFPSELWDEGFDAGRQGAKVMIYAKLFGSSDAGLGHSAVDVCRRAGLPAPRIPFRELGRMANVALARSMSGLDKLEKDAGAKVVANKYLVGLDGRHVPLIHPRLALVSLCQSGEAVVMKTSLDDFYFDAAPANGWVHGVDYAQCVNVHDEVQLEARPEIAKALGATFAACITRAGVTLGLRCAFAGKSAVGDSWAATH